MAPAVGDDLAARWRDHILTSMVKHLDTAAVTALTAYADGTLTAGVRTLGLAEGGVGLATSGGFIDDMRPQLDRLRSQIVDGTITVPMVPLERGGGASQGT